MDKSYVIHKSIFWDQVGPGRSLLLSHLDLELTERCNNACQHCYINLPQEDLSAKQREMTTSQWKEILCQAADLGALSVRFTGGEPLLREDFAKLYLFARRLGLMVSVFTNGRRITPELADLFACIPPLGKIEVTVYGMHPESYDAAACAPGAYFEFRQGIQHLLDRGVPFLVKGALLPSNKHEVEELEAWAATLPGMDGPLSFSMFFDQRGRRDSLARSRLINQVRIAPEEGVRLLVRQEDKYREEMQQFCSRFMGPEGDALFNCGAGKGGCVDAYGKFQPCMLLRDPALTYDTQTGSLGNALTHFFPRLKEIKSTNPVYIERCARCFLHGLCEQCPGKSWMENGTLDTPVEYICQVAHAQARYLGLLREGERAWEVQDGRDRVAAMGKRGE